MAVYIVTGKLGSGKTLACVYQIQRYLINKRRVAVNIDLNLDKLCKPSNKYSRVIRLPDLPTKQDLESLGHGYHTYNEEKFGGIFLDEGGVWLNSRDWSNKGRTDLLKFFLHLRKMKWDLYLAVQSLDVLDKQVRKSIAEHVVYLSRWDRLKLPWFLNIPVKILTLGRFKLPKLHHGLVRYGIAPNSMVVDEWWFTGKELYSAYSTMQHYDSNYDCAIYSILPPGYVPPRIPVTKKNGSFFMRITKIYLKRFSRFICFFSGVFLTTVIFSLFNSDSIQDVQQISYNSNSQEKEQSKQDLTYLLQYKIIGYSRFPDSYLYDILLPSGLKITSTDLQKQGFKTKDRGYNELLIIKGDDYVSIYR